MTTCNAIRAVLFSALLMPLAVQAGQDPTAPLGFQPPSPAVKKPSTRLPRLDAILCNEPTQCTAVLSGQGKRKGESIDGFTVRDINENHVVLQRNSKRWTLSVFNQQVLQ